MLLKVKSKKRKQNVFFLTEEGIKIAKEITKIISNS
jgi:predicted transcriptional regulator